MTGDGRELVLSVSVVWCGLSVSRVPGGLQGDGLS